MCSERDSLLKRLYWRTHAKLARLAGSGQLVWAAGCELSLALVHARRPVWPGETSETTLRVAPPRKTRPPDHTQVNEPWTLLLLGQHRWAQVGPTGEPREFRLAGSRQDKRLERAILLTTHLCYYPVKVNTLRPRQNGRYFTDDIFKYIFLNENVWISIKISLKFVPRVQLPISQHWFR